MDPKIVQKTALSLCDSLYRIRLQAYPQGKDVTQRSIILLLPVHSETCPYCTEFGNSCSSECRYGKLHGMCNEPGSVWWNLMRAAKYMEVNLPLDGYELMRIGNICDKYARVIKDNLYQMDVNMLMGIKKMLLAEIARMLSINEKFLSALEDY